MVQIKSLVRILVLVGVVALGAFQAPLFAQRGRGTAPIPAGMDPSMVMADRDMGGPMDSIAMLHMMHSPTRPATKDDSARAMQVVQALRKAIAKYRDTTAAVADGFVMFAPGLKNQPVYHFTKNLNAVAEAVRFDPTQPTSLLYQKTPTGEMKLVGAMYTMPKTAPLSKLDARIPLSIAQWHQHTNWCLPKATDPQSRWLEQRNGRPVFGPESPIATKADCDKVAGNFQDTVFGWMVHANVFSGDDLATIFSDHHGGE